MFGLVIASLLVAAPPVVSITVMNEGEAPVVVAVDYMEQPALARRTLGPFSAVQTSLVPQEMGALTVVVGDDQRAYAIPRGLGRGGCGSIHVFVGETVRAEGALGGSPWATHGCVDVPLESFSATGVPIARAPVQEAVCFALSPAADLDKHLAAALPKVVTLKQRAVAFWSDAERTSFLVEPTHAFYEQGERRVALAGHRSFALWNVDVDNALTVRWSDGFQSLTLEPAITFAQLLDGTATTAPLRYHSCVEGRDAGVVTMKRVPCVP